MMKRFIAMAATLTLFSLLVALYAEAQSKEEGILLFKEGLALQERSQSYSDLKQAEEKYLQAIAIFQRVGARKNLAYACGSIGMIYENWGQYEKAVEHYEKAIEICRELKDRIGERSPLNSLGNVTYARGQYDKAVEYYEKTLAICRELKDREGEGSALNNLGLVYMQWGRYDKAVEYYDKSLVLRKELKDRIGEGKSLLGLGIVHWNWGQYDKAMAYFEKSLGISRELKDLKGEGQSLCALGAVYTIWGQYDKAAKHFEKSLGISRELKDRREEGLTLNNLGKVYKDWGQYDKAVEHYEKSLTIRRELKDLAGEGQSLSSLGQVFQHRKDYKKALENYQKALAINTAIGVPTNGPEAHIADTYMDMGDLDKAEPLLEHAAYASYWGRFYLLRPDYAKAKEYYEKILASALENRNADELFTAYTGLGVVWEAMGNNAKAADHYAKAVDYTEELRASISLSARELYFDVRINGFYRTDPYKGLARVLAKMNRPTEALQQSEYGRARVFAETLSKHSVGLSLNVPKEVLQKDSQLNNQLAALSKSLQATYEKGNRLTIESLEPQVKELKAKLAAHLEMLRKQYPLLAATKYPQPMGLDQSVLKDDEWVLSYDVTELGTIIYLTRGKSVVKAIYQPIPKKDLDELVQQFRQPTEVGADDSVTKKLATFDFASGKKLTDILLAGILPDLPKNTPLIIVPDGSLGVVPFEMLVLNVGGKVITDKSIPYASGAEFFGDRNPISYYQSITALTLARTLGKQKKGGEKLLAMVDPVFSSDDPRLMTLARQERERHLANLPKDLIMSIETESGLTFPRLSLTAKLGASLKKADSRRTDLYEGLQAKKSVILDTDLTQYRSLVFATHGYFGKDLPRIQEPVLILTLPGQPKGQDGFLRMTEVMGLKLNCDIAALTACQTGLGRHISGEGTMGMGRAFQYAGAKSVLMSLWSVAERSSVLLVESFFKHLKEGKSKLVALKEARDEIRKAGYDHPFFWASFILVGEVN